MDLEIIILGSQTQKDKYTSHRHVESRKITQVNLITTQKQTHRLRA